MTRHSPCHRFICCILACVAVFAVSFDAAAASAKRKPGSTAKSAQPFSPGAWHVKITGNDASPSNLIAVDKKQQTLFLFERHSPLRLVNKFSCTTGQNMGDKLVEGDLKTPEGVYFVVRRLAGGLDYEKYGYEAYTLNYPNPVDKLRRKTGYGIWIHGRGVPITPNLTEGCVSLNNTDIAMLGKNLKPGTPVALAEGVSFSPQPTPDESATIRNLYRKTYGWAKAWSSKSNKFFEYYDPEAYAIAQGESFSSFRAQKERVFKHVKRIDVAVQNVQALQGPGYWVTWFQQDYRASNLVTKGVRRLYWQKDKKGELRIVGMEWAPHLSGTLTAGLNGAPVSDEPATAAKPVAVAEAKPVAAPKAAPVTPANPVASATKAPEAAKPEPRPEAVAVALAEFKKPEQKTGQAKTQPDSGKTAKAASQGPKVMDVPAFVEKWRTAWEKGDVNAYASFYAPDAIQGTRTGRQNIRSHKQGLWKRSRPAQVLLTNMRIISKQDGIMVDMHQSYTDSRSFADMGVKTLYLKSNGNVWQIIREEWSPMQQ